MGFDLPICDAQLLLKGTEGAPEALVRADYASALLAVGARPAVCKEAIWAHSASRTANEHGARTRSMAEERGSKEELFLRHPHLCAGQVKRLMRYAMHRAAERLTPAPQCTRTAAQSEQVLHSSR